MSQGTLSDRLERSRVDIARSMQARTIAQRELVALQEAASALEAVVSGPGHNREFRLEPTRISALEPLPLVLSGRNQLTVDPSAEVKRMPEHDRRRYVAPGLLFGSVLLLAVLMTYVTPEQPKPRFARPAAADTAPVMALQPVSAVMNPVINPAEPTAMELALLERCEALITRGEIRLARQELARAATEGSAHARFALAETFDPNMLAAWGLRDNVADAQIARTLYAQALTSGDTRAEPRLAALID